MHGVAEDSSRPTVADEPAVHGSRGAHDRLRGIDLVRAGPQRHEEAYRCIGECATAGVASDLASVQVGGPGSAAK